MSEAPQDNRSTAQIEADIAATRRELTDTVNELSNLVDPRVKFNEAKDKVSAVASDLSAAARHTAAGVGAKAEAFRDDVKNGDAKALGILGAGVAAIVAAVTFATRRSR